MADKIMVPIRSATTKRNSPSSTGIRIISTSSCPSSTPMLNESSDVSMWLPANCSVCRNANEKPNPMHKPESERDQPSAVNIAGAHDIFQRHIDDRRRN